MEAAHQGWVNAQYFLGSCFERGEEVEKDVEKARKYLSLAAGQGHNGAKEALRAIF
jgi:TPR repeat protein